MTSMKTLFRNIACVIALVSCVACSGTIDFETGSNTDNGNGAGPDTELPDSGDEADPMTQVPEGVLRIFADKTEISADGNDAVTFTVMFGSEDVSNAKTLQLIREYDGEQKYMSYSVNKFSTVTAGKYKFSAKYYYGGNNITDNSVEIVAKAHFTGEEKSYKRRYFGTLFTSTGCNSCPLAANGLKKLQSENPGLISIAAFHADMTVPDPMTIAETYELQSALGGFTGLPAFFWNMRESSYTGGNAFMESFAKEQAAYTTYSGVSVNTLKGTDDLTWEIQIGVTSNMPAIFRNMLILVEDNIPAIGEYEQNGQNSSYVHYNVVRKVLTSVSGDKMNDNLPLTVGVEAKVVKSVTLDPSWNRDNLRVIAAAMTSEDGGNTWTVNNVNECRLGESASYLYEE